MKSLLVDALRQANGTPQPDEEPSPPETVPEAANEALDSPPAIPTETPEGAQDKSELELIESTVLPAPLVHESPAAITADEDPDITEAERASAVEPLDDPVETSDQEEQSTVDTDVVDPAVLLPALDVDRAAERFPAPAETSVFVAVKPRRDPLMFLARWSPALCLVAMTAAAGSLAVYQKMTAANMNFDLGSLPAQSGSDTAKTGGAPAWQLMASSEAPAASNNVTAVQEQTTTVSVADRPSVAVPPDHNAQDRVIESTVTVHDPAFAAVVSAFEFYERGDFSGAERQYRLVLEEFPNHYDALLGLAAILQRTSRIPEALETYARLLAVNPDDTAAAASLAAHAQHDASVDPATRIRVLLQRSPDSAALHFSLGLVLANERRWPEAHDAFRAASRFQPGNADYSYNVAVSSQHLGDMDAAKSYYSAALRQLDEKSLVGRQAIVAQLNQLSSGDEGGSP